MLEPISTEEYELAKVKLENLKKELFDVRYDINVSEDIEKINLLKEKVVLIKREISRTKNDIKLYEWVNGKERVR